MMTMWPRSRRTVPAMTAQVAQAAFPNGCLAIRVRDTLGELFEDAQFTELFAVRGRPAVSPARLALVSVLQALTYVTVGATRACDLGPKRRLVGQIAGDNREGSDLLHRRIRTRHGQRQPPPTRLNLRPSAC